MTQYKQFFFDFDSTLVSVETLDQLVTDPAKRAEVEALTTASMNGDRSFADVFPHKMAIIAPSAGEVAEVAKRCMNEWIVPGVREAIEQIHASGAEAWIVTANFHALVDPVARHLGIPAERVLANQICFDENGRYVRCEASVLMQDGGKAPAIQPWVRDPARAVMIGDSVSDLACKNAVGLFVGFGGVVARPAVQEAADLFVTEPNMLAVLARL
jgi:phosphoserine phosphatase